MMQVLVAEDDMTSRTILAAILAKWGYDPLVAEDGGKAWEIQSSLSHHPDRQGGKGRNWVCYSTPDKREKE